MTLIDERRTVRQARDAHIPCLTVIDSDVLWFKVI